MTRFATWVGLVVGVGLMAAPAVFGYSGTTAGALHRIAGPVAASLAVIAAWEATRGVRWPNAVIGVALALAPVVVAPRGAAAVVGVVAGVALAAATPFGGPVTTRTGGGWRSLWQQPAG